MPNFKSDPGASISYGRGCLRWGGWVGDLERTRQIAGRAAKGALTAPEAREHILELLSDGEPRTFNRIGVELYERTADALYRGPVDDAL